MTVDSQPVRPPPPHCTLPPHLCRYTLSSPPSRVPRFPLSLLLAALFAALLSPHALAAAAVLCSSIVRDSFRIACPFAHHPRSLFDRVVVAVVVVVVVVRVRGCVALAKSDWLSGSCWDSAREAGRALPRGRGRHRRGCTEGGTEGSGAAAPDSHTQPPWQAHHSTRAPPLGRLRPRATADSLCSATTRPPRAVAERIDPARGVTAHLTLASYFIHRPHAAERRTASGSRPAA